MSSDAVVFKNVYKIYSKYTGFQKVKNFLDIIKNGQIGKKLIREADFYALNDITFSVKKGECLGIIGPNGAGKSTILKIINSITYPTKGKTVINGQVGGLLELGAGFHVDLPGRDNIFINAALNGFSKKQTMKIFEEILNISELHHYIDVPIKKYSSGMKVRLGFAVAMATNPEIVLLDEVLAVGDAKFKVKSLKMMKEYISNKTVIFVSHSMDNIREVCQRVLVLDHGKIIFDGETENAIECYNEINRSVNVRTAKSTLISRNVKRGFAELQAVEVASASILNYEHEIIKTALKGERIIIKCLLRIIKNLGNLYVRILIKKIMLQKFNEIMDEFIIKIPKKDLAENDKEVRVSFNTANLRAGNYSIQIIPEFENQPGKTALSVYRLPFSIESDSNEEQLGLVDLEFEVESSEIA